MKKIKLIGIVFILAIISNCLAADENQMHNIIKHKPIPELPFYEAWNSKLPIKNYLKAWTSWNSFFIQSKDTDCNLYSVKKNSGMIRWLNPVGFEIGLLPKENKNGLYILKDNIMHVIDPFQGGLIKKLKMSHAVAGNVDTSQFAVFSWEFGKKLHMLKTDKGFEKGWMVKAPSEINQKATPFVRLDYIYIPSPSGHLYCYDSKGEKLWEFININVYDDLEYYGKSIDDLAGKISKERQHSSPDLKKIKRYEEEVQIFSDKIHSAYERKRGKYLGEPAFYDHFIYIGSTDGSLFALNRFSGAPSWEYQSGTPILGKIHAIEDQVIFFPSESEGATSVKRGPSETTLNWKLQSARELLNVTKMNLYFRTDKNEVLCVDRKFGRKKWTWAIPSHLEVVADLYSDALFVINKTLNDGNITIYALTEDGNYPRVDDYQTLSDVGFHHYNDIERIRQEQILKEKEEAEKIQNKENEGGEATTPPPAEAE